MADFGSMSEEQREQHYLMVCKSLEIDPKLRLLDYIWMHSDSGPKSLVLYARRGAAEVFRQKRGISVTKTQREDGDGFVIYTVEGTDSKGRTEIAVGATSTKGLTGERLAYSVMTAHTRATRRLTLQFVGQGILDESEVNAPTADLSTSPASLAALVGSPVVLPPPQVQPAAAPGKDITPITTDAKPVTDHSNAQNPPKEGVSVQGIADTKADEVEHCNAGPEPKPKRAPRKKRNTVDLASPGQVSPSADIPESQRATTLDPDFASKQQARRGHQATSGCTQNGYDCTRSGYALKPRIAGFSAESRAKA